MRDVRPLQDLPAPGLPAQLADAGVVDGKITRLGNGLARHQPVDRIQHSAMAHHDHALTAIALHQIGQRRLDARTHLHQALAPLQVQIRIPRFDAPIGLGILPLDVGIDPALEAPEMTLAPDRLRHHRHARHGADFRRCLAGTQQVAAMDGIHHTGRKARRGCLRLLHTHRVERLIQLSLDAPHHVPVGLAVPHQHEAHAVGQRAGLQPLQRRCGAFRCGSRHATVTRRNLRLPTCTT